MQTYWLKCSVLLLCLLCCCCCCCCCCFCCYCCCCCFYCCCQDYFCGNWDLYTANTQRMINMKPYWINDAAPNCAMFHHSCFPGKILRIPAHNYPCKLFVLTSIIGETSSLVELYVSRWYTRLSYSVNWFRICNGTLILATGVAQVLHICCTTFYLIASRSLIYLFMVTI